MSPTKQVLLLQSHWFQRARLEFEVPEAKGSHPAPTMATLAKQQKPLPEVWPSAENKRRPLLRQTIARARAGYG